MSAAAATTVEKRVGGLQVRRVTLPDFGGGTATPPAKESPKTPPTGKAFPVQQQPPGRIEDDILSSGSSINFFQEESVRAAIKKPSAQAGGGKDNASDDESDLSLSLSSHNSSLASRSAPKRALPKRSTTGASAVPTALPQHPASVTPPNVTFQAPSSPTTGKVIPPTRAAPVSSTVDAISHMPTVDAPSMPKKRVKKQQEVDLEGSVNTRRSSRSKNESGGPASVNRKRTQGYNDDDDAPHNRKGIQQDMAPKPLPISSSLAPTKSAFPRKKKESQRSKSRESDDGDDAIHGPGAGQTVVNASQVKGASRASENASHTSKHTQEYRNERSDKSNEHFVDDGDNDSFVESVLPLHSKTNNQRGSTASPQYRSHSETRGDDHGGRTRVDGDYPLRRQTPPRGSSAVIHDSVSQDDPLETLLIRAQLRLREKERIDSASKPVNSSGLAFSSPVGRSHRGLSNGIDVGTVYGTQTPRGAASMRGGSTGHVVGSSQALMPPLVGGRPTTSTRSAVATPTRSTRNEYGRETVGYSTSTALSNRQVSPFSRRDMAYEQRLHLENLRLTEEVTYLTQECEKLRHGGQHTNMAETAKLQLQLETLRTEIEERESAAARKLHQVEDTLIAEKQHKCELVEQIQSYAESAEQYEQLLMEKDEERADLQEVVDRLTAESRERQTGLARQREEVERQRAAEKEKVERTLALFEDAKRQRTHLMELNDKLQREKDQAVADRRRAREEVVAVRSELQRLEERRLHEIDELVRDADRAKEAFVEKERTLNAQLKEERRANAMLQDRLGDREERTNEEVEHIRAALRTASDDFHKRFTQEREQRSVIEAKLQKCEAELHRVTSKLEAVNPEEKTELERSLRETSQALMSARQERDEAVRDVEHLRDTLERMQSETDVMRDDIARSTEMSRSWQQAKDKAESQNVKLSATLQRLLAEDEQQTHELKIQRDQIDSLRNSLAKADHSIAAASSLSDDVQVLISENERLTQESERLMRERDDLVRDNGALAEEMLKWRSEMRSIVSHKTR